MFQLFVCLKIQGGIFNFHCTCDGIQAQHLGLAKAIVYDIIKIPLSTIVGGVALSECFPYEYMKDCPFPSTVCSLTIMAGGSSFISVIED